jgi:MSHA biogenesis protein MshO
MPLSHRLLEQKGFTLIELVVVIVIAGILAALGGFLVIKPVTGYVDLARRTRLVDQAEMALRRMQRDIRQALPNSVRIGGSNRYLEILHTVDGGRYRAQDDPDPLVTTDDILDFTMADNGFEVLGGLREDPQLDYDLVIYNISNNGSSGNAYVAGADNVATVDSSAASTTANHITLSPAFAFANSSPRQRFFLVAGPVTYACEGDELYRYSGYGKAATQPVPPTGGSKDLVTGGIKVVSGSSDCAFSYDPGTSHRAGLVTLKMTLEEQGEEISLIHQIHVVNAP